jgi:hypothetical protein
LLNIQIEDGKEKTPVSNVTKVLPAYRKRASTLGVISEQSEHKHAEPRTSEDDTCKKAVNTKPITICSPNRNNGCKPNLKPTAKAGMFQRGLITSSKITT